MCVKTLTKLPELTEVQTEYRYSMVAGLKSFLWIRVRNTRVSQVPLVEVGGPRLPKMPRIPKIKDKEVREPPEPAAPLRLPPPPTQLGLPPMPYGPGLLPGIVGFNLGG